MNNTQLIKDFLFENKEYQEYLNGNIRILSPNIDFCITLAKTLEQNEILLNQNSSLLNGITKALESNDINDIKRDLTTISNAVSGVYKDKIKDVRINVISQNAIYRRKIYTKMGFAKTAIRSAIETSLMSNKIDNIFNYEFIISYESGLIEKQSMKEYALKINAELLDYQKKRLSWYGNNPSGKYYQEALDAISKFEQNEIELLKR